MKKKFLIFSLVLLSSLCFPMVSKAESQSPHSTECSYELVSPAYTYNSHEIPEFVLANLKVTTAFSGNDIKLEFTDQAGITTTLSGSSNKNFEFDNNNDQLELKDAKGTSRNIYIPKSDSFINAFLSKDGKDVCPVITVIFTKKKGWVLYFEGAKFRSVSEQDLENIYGKQESEASDITHIETGVNNKPSSNSSSNSSSNDGASKSDFVGNLTCGGSAEINNGVVEGIRFHENLPKFTNALYDILKIGTPVILIITGMLDILKAVSAQKEDDMNKATKKFLNRLLAGAVVFLVFVIVETVVNLAIPDDIGNGWNCVECFLTDYNKCSAVGTVK